VIFTGTFEGTSMKGSIQAMGYTLEFSGTKPARMASLQAGGCAMKARANILCLAAAFLVATGDSSAPRKSRPAAPHWMRPRR